MQEHWIKNIEEKWQICYDDCVICKSNVNLSYPGIRTLRTNNAIKVGIVNKLNPTKKFVSFYQYPEFEELVNNVRRPTTVDLLCNVTDNLNI
jgi:hypothetical protein